MNARGTRKQHFNTRPACTGGTSTGGPHRHAHGGSLSVAGADGGTLLRRASVVGKIQGLPGRHPPTAVRVDWNGSPSTTTDVRSAVLYFNRWRVPARRGRRHRADDVPGDYNSPISSTSCTQGIHRDGETWGGRSACPYGSIASSRQPPLRPRDRQHRAPGDDRGDPAEDLIARKVASGDTAPSPTPSS